MQYNRTKLLVIFAEGLAVVSIVYALLFYFYFSMRVTPQTATEENIEYTKSGLPIPKNVHYYNGAVMEKGEDYFIVRVSSYNNYVTDDTELKIYIDERTEFAKLLIPKTFRRGKMLPQTKEVASSKEEIREGQTIMVYSRGNIRREKEFEADKIILLDI